MVVKGVSVRKREGERERDREGERVDRVWPYSGMERNRTRGFSSFRAGRLLDTLQLLFAFLSECGFLFLCPSKPTITDRSLVQ